MSEQEFIDKYGCFGRSLEDLPPDAISEAENGSVFIIEELIPKDF